MKKILLMMGLSIANFVATAQTISTYAGSGDWGVGTLSLNTGDGGLATSATLNTPALVCKDALGNLYFGDNEEHLIRKVDANGIITTLATGVNSMSAICVNTTGTSLYFTDAISQLILKMNLGTGNSAVIVGGGDSLPVKGPATEAAINVPRGLCVDASGNIFFTASYIGAGRVFRVDAQVGTISIFAGTEAPPTRLSPIDPLTGDNDSAKNASFFGGPLCFDNDGNLFIAEVATGRCSIRKIAAAYPNIITRYAGDGQFGSPNYVGEGGLATNARFSATAIAFDGNGNLFISCQQNNIILVVPSSTHIIKKVAGTGTYPSFAGVPTILGDGGLPKDAEIKPNGICVDAIGLNVFFADPSNHRIRRIFLGTPYSGNISCPITMLGTTGSNNVCVGSTITLSNATVIPVGASATWKSIVGNASINSVTGVATGISAGAALIKYTVSLGAFCKKDTSFTLTVNPIPVVPTIVYAPGTSNPQAGAPRGGFCVGKIFSVQATPNVPAGVWSSTGVITISSLGVVTINAVGNGSIKYTYTSVGGCVNSRTMIGNGFSCAARGAISNEQLTTTNEFVMFPNPAKSVVSLSVDNIIGKGSIVVTDLYGKIVKTQCLSMGINAIDITNLVKGFYLISVITNDGKSTKKLIVE